MDKLFVSTTGKLPRAMNYMKVYVLFTVVLVLLHYSAAGPMVSAKVGGMSVEEGSAAYIDYNTTDPQPVQVSITCRWRGNEKFERYEIFRWDNQSEDSRKPLYDSIPNNGNGGSYTLPTFRPGRYGCAGRNKDTVTFSGEVYLSGKPTVRVERLEDVPGWANFFCNVTDDFYAFSGPDNVSREFDFRYSKGTGNETDTNEFSTIPDDQWKISNDSAKLTVSDALVREWAEANVRLACLVKKPKAAFNDQGKYLWSPDLPITVPDQPTVNLPQYVTPAAVSSTLVVVLLIIVVLFVLIVIVLKRKNRQIEPSQETDVEQGQQDFRRYPCLGHHHCLPQVLQLNGVERTRGDGLSPQVPYNPNSAFPVADTAVALPGTCTSHCPASTNDHELGQQRQQADGQTI